MRAAATVVICVALLGAAACGGESGGGAPAASEEGGEAAYEQAYKDAWVAACKAAVKDIRKRDPGRPTGKVACTAPQGQQEGNTAFDPQNARAQGREEGTFDGCAYAWDEAYATSAVDVAPRC